METSDKKILIINPYYSDQKITASNICFRELFSDLDSFIDNCVFVTDKPELPNWIKVKNIKHIFVDVPIPIFRRLYFYIYVTIYLAIHRVDIIFSEFNPLPITALLSTKVWLRIYHIERNLVSRRGQLKEFGLRIYLKFYYWLSLFSDNYRILTISETSKRDIENAQFSSTDKIDISYCGVKSESYTSYINHSTELIDYDYDFIYVGSFSERKNVGLIPEALSKIDKRLRVLMIGKDLGTKDRVLEKFRSKCPQHSLDILQDLTDEQIMECYSKSAIFITASLHEGFGMPVVEAACLGIPVVCSSLEVFKELNPDAIFCVDNNADSFSQSMNDCIIKFESVKETSLYKSKGYLKLYDWKQHTERLLNKLIDA